MDWNEVGLDEPTRSQTRPVCGALSTLDAAKLIVIARLQQRSVAAIIQEAVLTYLKETWEANEDRLIVEANRQDKTPEELFVELYSGEDI
jgi:hypothetical protein